MALTINEWQKEAEKLDTWKRTELIAAIKTLQAWKPFKDNYGWTGFETIGTILNIAQENFTNEIAESLKQTA